MRRRLCCWSLVVHRARPPREQRGPRTNRHHQLGISGASRNPSRESLIVDFLARADAAGHENEINGAGIDARLGECLRSCALLPGRRAPRAAPCRSAALRLACRTLRGPEHVKELEVGNRRTLRVRYARRSSSQSPATNHGSPKPWRQRHFHDSSRSAEARALEQVASTNAGSAAGSNRADWRVDAAQRLKTFFDPSARPPTVSTCAARVRWRCRGSRVAPHR